MMQYEKVISVEMSCQQFMQRKICYSASDRRQIAHSNEFNRRENSKEKLYRGITGVKGAEKEWEKMQILVTMEICNYSQALNGKRQNYFETEKFRALQQEL